MSRTRASRLSVRAALVAVFVLTSALPASAASPTVSVTTTASPLTVTVGLPIAYVVNVSNDSRNTLNHVTLEGRIDPAFTYLDASPDELCSDTAPVCDFGQVGAGGDTPEAIFYFTAPASPGNYDFTAVAIVGEGPSDNNNASHQDTFSAPPVETEVLEVSPDLVRAHSVPGIREFTTGLGTVNAGNPHGTTVVVPTNAEVTLRDVAPGPEIACPAAVGTCFGWGSVMSIGNGAEFPDGLKVTIRWDYSQLPSGMTARKLRFVHLLDGGGFERVDADCVYDGAGAPTNLPCIAERPVKLADRDIIATYYLLTNRVGRGY
jgi:hypothetical protein